HPECRISSSNCPGMTEGSRQQERHRQQITRNAMISIDSSIPETALKWSERPGETIRALT
ncbi:MAG: hypothetical protein ACK58T_35125, partial [Phycisphaerae bacterium]